MFGYLHSRKNFEAFAMSEAVYDLPLSTSIPQLLHQDKVVVYEITCSFAQDQGDPIEWKIKHRFSEFVALRDTLSKFCEEVPSLPEKGMLSWLRAPSRDFLEKRRIALQDWLDAMTLAPVVYNSDAMVKFLQLAEHVELTKYNLPVEIVDNHSPDMFETLFTVSDFDFLPSEGIILTVCEDPDVLSRLDTKVMNLMADKSKGDEEKLPVGAFTCFRIGAPGCADCLASIPFYEDFIPCTVAWHAPSRTAVLGSTNGSIWLYTASPDWAEWKLSKQLDGYHADRITKMSIVARGRPNGEKGKQQSADAQVEAAADDGADGDAEPKTADLLLTCGKDRILLAYDLARILEPNCVVSIGVCAKSQLTALAYDQQRDMVYLGAVDQNIYVYDISVSPPVMREAIAGNNGSVQSLHYVPNFSPEAIPVKPNYLFAGTFTGKVQVLSIPPYDESNNNLHDIKSLTFIGGGPQSKIQSLASCVNHVAVGYQNGMIGIWNRNTGALWHVIRAHKGPVKRLQWLEQARVLVSAGDYGVRFWQFPVKIRPYARVQSSAQE